jgi:hypothetical protein
LRWGLARHFAAIASAKRARAMAFSASRRAPIVLAFGGGTFPSAVAASSQPSVTNGPYTA